MRIIECDRCHKRIDNKDEVGYVALDWRSIRTDTLAGTNTLDSWDFCDECMEAITDFVQHIKPKAVIKRPISADMKYAPVTTEKIELIKRMAREGRTVKEICESTGVSDPTVRKYKKEVDNAADSSAEGYEADTD